LKLKFQIIVGEMEKLLHIFTKLNVNVYHTVSTRQSLSSDLMMQRINYTLEFQSEEQEKKVIQELKDKKYIYNII